MEIFYIVYLIVIFFGFVLGFTFDGVLVLAGGILVSLFAKFFWHDAIFANVAAFISAGLAVYSFSKKTH